MHGIFYAAKYDLELVGFTDSDWAGNNKNWKFTSGYVFILANGPISWLINKNSSIALSFTEADYRGALNATTQCLWL